jgi:catalase
MHHLVCLQERFVGRVASMLADPRCTAEIRRVWIGYWTQADAQLGSRITQKLQQMGSL